MIYFYWQTLYKWDPAIEDMVYAEFARTCQRRLPQLIYDMLNRAPKNRQTFIPDDQLSAIKERRATESFLKKLATQKDNRRRFSEDGKLVPTHHGGSGSIFSRANKLVSFL